jgi:hypothetical protein
MNFSKLKLNESIAQGAGTGLAANAVLKTGQTAGNGKQMSNTSNNVGMQQNQMAQKQGVNKATTVQRSGGGPQNTPQVQAQVEEYLAKMNKAKDEYKRIQESKSDWKQELTEALGLNDTAFHPYVDVMPFKSQKFDDTKKKLARETGKQVREETLEEKAPPGAKYERMVKHIKKNYPKDQEGIAYATAWKQKNKDEKSDK